MQSGTKTNEMMLDFTEKFVTERGEFTVYYKGSQILKSLDEICYERLLVSVRGNLSYAGFTKASNLLKNGKI